MLPESASVMLLGAVVGFLATRWKASAAELEFLTFSPEVSDASQSLLVASAWLH